MDDAAFDRSSGSTNEQPLHPLTIEFLVCKYMGGWTRATFRSQPPSFINNILAHLDAEFAASSIQASRQASRDEAGFHPMSLMSDQPPQYKSTTKPRYRGR